MGAILGGGRCARLAQAFTVLQQLDIAILSSSIVEGKAHRGLVEVVCKYSGWLALNRHTRSVYSLRLAYS